MYIQNFEAFLIAITILTLTPGLDTALVIRNTSRAGMADGCVTSLGICVGLFVHATFSAIGISAILTQSAELFHIIKMAGAGYLIWLGFSSLRSLSKAGQGMQVTSLSHTQLKIRRSLREGFLSNVLNPKTAVFYLAFLPQFINPEHSPLLQSLFMAGLHFMIAMVWQCGLAGALSSAKNLLKNNTFMRWMEGATGVVLVGLGIKLMTDDSV
ncbi:LysE family translocator [Vibrio cincinnatiensis]|jgi:RhtB (resistance to homoserine/threonine) family protein|uniref:Resistance to homoserine/threonine (RhtB) family protein n=1 Tax=Vibrio cincinnatiensis DSM 19608 TaxID=1123491 RepID=A0A1T4LVF2_VIBCI|nr:LysE family translocator [Vibrio cincinnatiensis]MCG3725707.1 LysE family translocator [Vibrio cincinnatiensis]MCG3732511.1 LysE family translocator [Vibrio cincinnatiensis]MCG3740463.1 LysE family translocator [Vibrio cincinnatiensis]MCG3742829.1 LysE family translocator [Vibrio cincinnatiensis]MCG3766416.1 LysE family translocator [Vibrio cincinnatiensis]